MSKILNRDFLNYGGLFYFYFMIWAIVLAFLPLWLKDTAGLNEAESGFVFSAMSLIALCYHPFFGVIQDKLRFRKNLFAVIAIALLFMGPFFSYLFQELLSFNVYAGALLGSSYLSLCFFGGVGVVESYIEKVSRKNGFEYGHVRLFGSIAGATATFIGGLLYVNNPDSIFWFGSGSAVLLCILLYLARVRTDGSAVFTTPVALSAFRLIAAFEMPLMLVSVMKYIASVFDVRLSATVYLLGFNLAKQGSVVIFSSIAGGMYASLGFQSTYMFLAISVLIITIISIFTLKNDKHPKEKLIAVLEK